MCNVLTETVLLFFLLSWPWNSLQLFRLQVYPLHSSVTLDEQNIVFLHPVSGYRKVNFSFFFPLLWHAMCSRRLFYWQSPPSLRSSCPPTLPKVQWLFPMWNTVGLSIPLARVFKSTFMLILCFSLSQWLTSAWRVAWFVTKTPISSFCVSPGHRKPAATSVEVQRSQRCCL